LRKEVLISYYREISSLCNGPINTCYSAANDADADADADAEQKIINNNRLGLSVGGLIKQKIYRDTTNLADYDMYNIETFTLKIYNSQQLTTGLPYTPISMNTYVKYGFPWFDIYDEKMPAINNIPENTPSNIEPVEQDDLVGESKVCIMCKTKYVNVEYTPCGHKICSDCFVEQSNKGTYLQCHLCNDDVITSQVKLLNDIIDYSSYKNNDYNSYDINDIYKQLYYDMYAAFLVHNNDYDDGNDYNYDYAQQNNYDDDNNN
jgi:hypothetical protein